MHTNRRNGAKSYEELIAGHYAALAAEASPAAVAEKLFESYYGRPVAPQRRHTPVVLTLSFDDGETPRQRLAPAVQEYVPAGSLACEEYVVASAQLARSASLAIEEVAPAQEYLVEVSPAEPVVPTPPPTPPVKAPSATARMAPPPPPPVEPRLLPAAEPRPTPPSEAQSASDDDFMADMQSILTGRKVFDPATGRTVEKGQVGRPPPAPPPSEPNSSQAIFDRIAQSMQYANTFDLGTVELNNRFADFDKLAELQQRGGQKQKSAPGPAAPDTAEFMKDLEAIRGQRPARYSEPFYDTGEHVLIAADLYPDQLRVGKSPGVALSYGQVIAMGDLYESVDQMMATGTSELQKIKGLLARSTAYYKGGKKDDALDVSDDLWDAATRDRYLELAEDNYAHFSPNYLFKNAQFNPGTPWRGNHQRFWEQHHRRAIEEAQRLFLESNNVSVFLEWPLIINAFGDHFLTDAFAAGHVINKEEVIEYFKANFFESGNLRSTAKDFFARVAALSFKGEVRKRFSVLETFEPIRWWFPWHPNIDTENAFRKLLVQAAEQQPDAIANLAVKALHDRLNRDGIQVYNDAGDRPWLLQGDGHLNDETRPIVRRAVVQSVANLDDPGARASNIDFPTYFDKVWRHVPKLTDASKKKLVELGADYTRPDSKVLEDAAADLITRKLNSMIKKLKKEKKLRDA